ncbi:hypothetical protein PGT21_028909 [Puccinia graminis f. sp. tritici]|uniref:Uncharacterized protein n=1 Tax=Puccinia graminis f. sp. tritici TaxID=56615 RepID=A0A5B0RZB0_PUCGR|nr:hypothetical protein PGT21_028909 [Puccinia graminis f. sp. tritici]KAA1131241.1 hypothetical protein PGTUg99_026637 [Puccinia graminis f. sp. tritici]
MLAASAQQTATASSGGAETLSRHCPNQGTAWNCKGKHDLTEQPKMEMRIGNRNVGWLKLRLRSRLVNLTMMILDDPPVRPGNDPDFQSMDGLRVMWGDRTRNLKIERPVCPGSNSRNRHH